MKQIDYQSPQTSCKSILQEADEIAGENRSRDYDHPLQNHQRIADVWNMQIGTKLKVPITAREVALMMIGLKLAREANTPKRDNLVDAAGYIKCVDMIDAAIAMEIALEANTAEAASLKTALPPVDF